jgi:hypothetical protein
MKINYVYIIGKIRLCVDIACMHACDVYLKAYSCKELELYIQARRAGRFGQAIKIYTSMQGRS